MALLWLVFAMCVVYCFALPPAGSRDLSMAMNVAVALGQLLILAQMGTVLGEIEIPWGHPFSNILDVICFFMLDMDFLQLDCAAGLCCAHRFLVGFAAPLLVILTYVLAALCSSASFCAVWSPP